MDPALWLGATAAKLSSVTPVGTSIMAIGGVIAVAGWLWLVYQNGRFGVVHGVLSLIIPIYALIFAFAGLEHRHKSPWTAAFLGGAIVAGLGYSLVYAAADCENTPECGIRRNMSEEINDSVDEEEPPPEGDESSALLRYRECGLGV